MIRIVKMANLFASGVYLQNRTVSILCTDFKVKEFEFKQPFPGTSSLLHTSGASSLAEIRQ